MNCALFVMTGWIVSLCLHEFCHALVAYLGGDKSVKEKGYLTLNPLKYTDVRMTLIIPAIMVALGGIALPGAAVYINRANLKNRFWESAVSLAGPFGTGLSMFLFAIPFLYGIDLPADWMKPSLAFLIFLEAVALILNSLPFPPLDGYGFIAPWLPKSVRSSVNRIGPGSVWILFAILWFVRPVNDFIWISAAVISASLNVPGELISDGFALFRKQAVFLILAAVAIAILVKPKQSSNG